MSQHKQGASCVLIRAVAMLGAKWQEAMHVMTTSAVLASMGHRVYFDGSVWDLMGPVTACARTPGLYTCHVEVRTAPSCKASAPLHVVQLSADVFLQNVQGANGF
jgi:hypothetical protein